MRTMLRAAALAAATTAAAGAAGATTLHLDGFTAGVQTVTFQASPVPNTPGSAGASGIRVTDTSGNMGSFVAWCLDVGHWLMGTGQSQDYVVTSTPWSNAYGISAGAVGRVQSVFDANFETLNLADADVAAAFQMALWEAAFEGAGNGLGMTSGLFRATSNGSTGLADGYLANAASYAGPKKYNLTFLEVEGYGPNRGTRTGQNLVTVSPVPLPAAGLMLLTGLAGLAVARRRRG